MAKNETEKKPKDYPEDFFLGVFEGMPNDEVALSFKHMVDVGALERKGRSQAKIEAIIRRARTLYLKDMKKLQKKKLKEKERQKSKHLEVAKTD